MSRQGDPRRTESEPIKVLVITAEPEPLLERLPPCPAGVHFLYTSTVADALPLLPQVSAAAYDLALGLENIGSLRAQADGLPVIALVSPGEPVPAAQLWELGADDYLLKEAFDCDALLRAIRHAQQKRQIEALLAERQLLVEQAAGEVARRIEAENDWRESEERFHAFFETARQGLLVGDSQGQAVRVNRALQEILGYDEAELLQVSPLDLTHPDDRQQDLQLFGELMAGKQSHYRLEKRYLAKDGRVVWGDLAVSAVRDQEGQVRFAFGMLADITERKQAEQALRESEQLYRTLVEQSSDAIYVLFNGKLELINQRFSEMFAVTPEEVRASAFDFIELVALESVPLVQDRARRVAQGEALPQRYEFLARSRDGREIPVEASVSYIPFRGGTAVQGILRDVTDRKRIADAVQASERRFRALIEHSSDAVSLLDANGTIIYTSPVTTRILGYSLEEYVGRNAFELLHPDDFAAVAHSFGQLLADPGASVALEFRYRHREGHWVWLEGVGRNLLGEAGIQAIVVNVRNITARKQYEDALRHRANELAALHDTFLDIVTPRDLPDVLQSIVERVVRLVESHGGALYLCDPERRELCCVVSHNTLPDHLGTIIKYGEGAAGVVAETGQPLVVEDYRRWPGRVAVYRDQQIFAAVLSVPMLWNREVTGVLQLLYDSGEHAMREANLELLTLFASQASLAVESTRLLQNERQQRELAEALREVGATISSTLDFEAVLDHMLDQIARVVPYDAANVCLVEQGRTRVVRQRGYDQVGRHLPDQIARLSWEIAATPNLLRMMETGQPLVIPDVRVDDAWVPVEWSIAQSWAGAPISVQGEVIAFFSMDKAEPNFYQPEHAVRLAAFAGHAALALHNARLFAETRQRARELNLLNRVIAAAATTRDEIELFSTGCRELAHFFDVPQAALALFDSSHHSATVVAEYLAEGRPSALHVKLPVADNPAMVELLSSRAPVAITDVHSHPATDPIRDVLRERGTASLLIVPIVLRAQVVGTLGIDSLTSREFSAEEVELAKTVGEELGRALETARLQERLRSHAAELEQRVAERTRELAEANERLKELDRLKSKFVSDVSHELRTPITNLTLYLDLLNRGKPEKHDTYMAVINEETVRLGRLIEDILNLSRLQLGQDRMVFEATDLNELCARVVAAHRLRAEAAGLRLIFTPVAGLPSVPVAGSQLNLALSNLVANAINYTAAGFVQVSAGFAPEHKAVYFQVADTGMGIEVEDQAHLFERFYRGRRTSQSTMPGTGLGLAIVKEVVELHDGRIEVESEPDRGSTFRIWLPVRRAG